MTHPVVPPEFQIKPTQVIEYEEPNPNTFYPNNQGGTGWSPLPPGLDEAVGMDPLAKYGQDPGAAAAQSGADAVRELIRITGISQENKTRVTEHEGGSHVEYHEISRDDQISNVYGQAIKSDPQSVQQALLIGNKGVQRAATIDAERARTLIDRQTQGMNDGTAAAFKELLAQKGSESIESVSAGINEAIGTRIVKSTDSGVPFHPELQKKSPVYAEFKELMKYHGERQRKGAAKPMAQYHPAQSNYQSRNGTFGALPASTGPGDMYRRVSGSTLGPATTYPRPPAPTPTMLTAPTDTQRSAMYSMASRLMPTADTAPTNYVKPPSGPQLYTAPTPEMGTERPPIPGMGDEDSHSIVGEDGLSYYDYGAEIAADEKKSKTMKIALAAAAGLGLILLLRG